MQDSLIIGIAGGSGSGKTTLAKNISAHFGERITLIRHDDYYRSFGCKTEEEKERINYDHPDAFDTALLIKNLSSLKAGMPTDAPIYDYTTHTRSEMTRRLYPTRVILVEGLLILENPTLAELFDMKIYVDTDADVRILRRIVRDMKERGRSLESIIRQYLTTVKPMHEAFVEPSKRRADIIVPEGGNNPIALEMIIDKIEGFLRK